MTFNVKPTNERETGLKETSFTYFLIGERIDKDISVYCMCITSYFRRNKEAATVTLLLLADDMESPSYV